MSTLILVTAAITLCLGMVQPINFSWRLWRNRNKTKTPETKLKVEGLLLAGLSLMLAILAVLLCMFSKNEIAIPILVGFVCVVGNIYQAIYQSLYLDTSRLWLGGVIFIFSFIEAGLCALLAIRQPSEIEPRLYIVLLLFVLEQACLALRYLTIVESRTVQSKVDACLHWNMGLCGFTIGSSLTSLGLYDCGQVRLISALLIVTLAILVQILYQSVIQPQWSVVANALAGRHGSKEQSALSSRTPSVTTLVSHTLSA